jgi:hypothetical protein
MKQAAHTVKTFCIEDAPLARHRYVDRWWKAIHRAFMAFGNVTLEISRKFR